MAILTLVPCDHYWLAVHYGAGVTAICKYRGCQKRGYFSQDVWNQMKAEGYALDKPTRV